MNVIFTKKQISLLHEAVTIMYKDLLEGGNYSVKETAKIKKRMAYAF